MLSLYNISIADKNTWYLIRSAPTYPNMTVYAQVWWARKGQHPEYGEVWVNRRGGFLPAPKSYISIVRTQEAEDFWDLPQTDTSQFQALMNPPSGCRLGWLSPTADFHPCAYFAHDDYANIVLDKAVAELEQAGWCRITGSDQFPQVRHTFLPNNTQAEWLLNNGYV